MPSALLGKNILAIQYVFASQSWCILWTGHRACIGDSVSRRGNSQPKYNVLDLALACGVIQIFLSTHGSSSGGEQSFPDLRSGFSLLKADPDRPGCSCVGPSRWHLGCLELALHFSLIPLSLDTQHWSKITGQRGWPQNLGSFLLLCV